jgi:hypothetical protein
MPPKKSAPKPATESASAAALVLFAQNMEEIRRWYRGASDPGRDLGHIVISELIVTHVSTALDMALRGERWQCPKQSP